MARSRVVAGRKRKTADRAKESAAAGVPQDVPRAAARHPGRVEGVDALRGVAILMMFAYHFAFDLRFYRVTAADFENDPFWLTARAIIVTSFMTLVGLSLVLADANGVPWSRFLRRTGWIAAGALAASLGSWLVFPASFIYFGILHAIAVTSLLAWPLRRHPRWALAIAIVVLVAGVTWTHPWFDQPAWSVLGFTTHKPVTEDYVPLAPWSAATFAGIALGHWLGRHRYAALVPLAHAPSWLRWMGRHSLVIYLLHQPVLLGVLALVLR